MKKIEVLFVRNDKLMPEDLWLRSLDLIPKNQHLKITKFYNWKDRQASLIGKLLLKKVIEKNIEKNCISNVKYTKYQKPYLDEDFSFNISHSGEYVVFAYTLTNDPIGIDIEKINPIMRIEDFHSVLTDIEKSNIYKSEKPIKAFYDLWTIKEAVSKADGRGLNIPLKEIKINENHIIINTNKWYYKNVSITTDYKCHISTSNKNFDVNLVPMTIDNLYETIIKNN
ncbi:4'-phosphopantetheinyl transferase family protein [Tenacibaculum ovolyticum]|uniref:4'-phosphopantetheinyl transferase family protein n=1 Tax=Tenacibaculum ovolyticum TaxID=104270 RepID=UPI003BA9CE6A